MEYTLNSNTIKDRDVIGAKIFALDRPSGSACVLVADVKQKGRPPL
jgi:hypothetical protein